jgi:hypothetical protein
MTTPTPLSEAEHTPSQLPAHWTCRPLAPDVIPALAFNLLWFLGVGSLIGVLRDHMALGNSRGWLRGEGIAVVALVFGYTGLTALFAIIVLMAG